MKGKRIMSNYLVHISCPNTEAAWQEIERKMSNVADR